MLGVLNNALVVFAHAAVPRSARAAPRGRHLCRAAVAALPIGAIAAKWLKWEAA
jgi:hypothetical protein